MGIIGGGGGTGRQMIGESGGGGFSGTFGGSGSGSTGTAAAIRKVVPRSGHKQIFVPIQTGVPVRAGALQLSPGDVVEAYPGSGNTQSCTVGTGPNEAQYGPNLIVSNTNLQPVILHVQNLSQIWVFGSQAAGATVGVLLNVRQG